MTTFSNMLSARWVDGKRVCVGLDPDLSKIPDCYTGTYVDRVFDFMMDIIEATHPYASAYKPNIAFFEKHRYRGLQALNLVINRIRRTDPGIPIILDFKRGDIGNFNKGYVELALDHRVDGITVHPYLGMEAMAPFIQAGVTVFVLCRTSNEGAGEFQDFEGTCHLDITDGMVYSTPKEFCRETGNDLVPAGRLRTLQMPLYQFVAHRVAKAWSQLGDCGVVAGATYTEELETVRQIVGDEPILVPGIGKQGGDLEEVIRVGLDSHQGGLVINNSSAILYADLRQGPEQRPIKPKTRLQTGTAANQAAEQMNTDILQACQALV